MSKFWLLNKKVAEADTISDDALRSGWQRNMLPSYKRWMKWVKVERPMGFHRVQNARLKGLRPEAAADLTPEVAAHTFDSFEALLLEVGVISSLGAPLSAEGAARIAWADEKGITEVTTKMLRGLHTGSGSASTGVGVGSMGHLTLLPFVSLDGAVADPYVVTTGATVADKWSEVWPRATIRCTPRGSITAGFFAEAAGLWARDRRKVVPQEHPLVLVLDSGGGARLHVSAEFAMVCMTWNVRPFYLYANTTRAFMLLDQEPQCCHSSHCWGDPPNTEHGRSPQNHPHHTTPSSPPAHPTTTTVHYDCHHMTPPFMLLGQDPNLEAERLWHHCRRKNTVLGLNTAQALHVAKYVFERAYCAAKVINAGKKVGLQLGEKLDRASIMVRRAPDLFRSVRPKPVEAFEDATTPELTKSLETYKPAASPVKCVGCSARITSAFRCCHRCGLENKDYQEAAAVVHGYVTSKRTHPPELPAPVQEAVAPFSEGKGDLIGQMRKLDWATFGSADDEGQGETAIAEKAPSGQAIPATEGALPPLADFTTPPIKRKKE